MDSGEEVAGGLVIAGGKGAELLQFAKEVLDPVACLVEVLVVGALEFAIGLGRNHGRFSGRRQRLENSLVGIVAFIGQHDGCFEDGQQPISPFQITGLSRCQQESRRMAQGIDGGMNFRAQPAFTAADRLLCPVFF
jgi:hypothetical protein